MVRSLVALIVHVPLVYRVFFKSSLQWELLPVVVKNVTMRAVREDQHGKAEEWRTRQ